MNEDVKPVIVTGCGRSGTHWLGGIMERVLGVGVGAFEPRNIGDISDVVVDSRLRVRIDELRDHRILHLVRDGRDVVRSLHTWYDRTQSFERCCSHWAGAIDMMAGVPILRLEDLTARADPAASHTLPHWTEWDAKRTDTFWNTCGRTMKEMGYDEKR